MRKLLGSLAMVAILAAPLVAQEVPEDGGRAEELRRQIEDRFSARVQEQLGLNDEQSAKMRSTVVAYFTKRRSFETDDRRLRTALAGQLRPGVAAD